MSSPETPEETGPRPRGVLCLGEAQVEMVCEQHVDRIAEADRFRPHFGGTPASVALLAARAGVPVTLAGGVGPDDWGRWIVETLHDAGVDTFRFRMIHGTQTPLSVITVASDGRPSHTTYAESAGTVAEALGADVEQAVAEHAALFITSGSLIAPGEREVTMRAVAAARKLARPVIFDPHLRLERWPTRADAAASANACVPGTLLLCVSAEDAALMTGESDVERAAVALRKTGAANVVILLGPGGAILRGRIRVDAPGPPINAMASTLGVAEALTAVLLTRLIASDFYEPALAAGFTAAVAGAAAACEHWGAID